MPPPHADNLYQCLIWGLSVSVPFFICFFLIRLCLFSALCRLLSILSSSGWGPAEPSPYTPLPPPPLPLPLLFLPPCFLTPGWVRSIVCEVLGLHR